MSLPKFIVIPPYNIALDVNEIYYVSGIFRESNSQDPPYNRCINSYYFYIFLRNEKKITISIPNSYSWETVKNTTARIDPKQERIQLMAWNAINVLRNGVIRALPCEKIEVEEFLLDPATMSPEQYSVWLEKASLKNLENFGDTGVMPL